MVYESSIISYQEPTLITWVQTTDAGTLLECAKYLYQNVVEDKLSIFYIIFHDDTGDHSMNLVSFCEANGIHRKGDTQ